MENIHTDVRVWGVKVPSTLCWLNCFCSQKNHHPRQKLFITLTGLFDAELLEDVIVAFGLFDTELSEDVTDAFVDVFHIFFFVDAG